MWSLIYGCSPLAFRAILKIFFKLVSEILEVLLNALGTMLGKSVGPSLYTISLRIHHHVMHVSGYYHVINSDFVAAKELEIRSLIQIILQFFKKFWYVSVEECLHSDISAFGWNVPYWVVKILVLPISFKSLINALASTNQ